MSVGSTRSIFHETCSGRYRCPATGDGSEHRGGSAMIPIQIFVRRSRHSTSLQSQSVSEDTFTSSVGQAPGNCLMMHWLTNNSAPRDDAPWWRKLNRLQQRHPPEPESLSRTTAQRCSERRPYYNQDELFPRQIACRLNAIALTPFDRVLPGYRSNAVRRDTDMTNADLGAVSGFSNGGIHDRW